MFELITNERIAEFRDYLLSDERNAITSEVNRHNVTHADVWNFFECELDADV